MEIRNIVITNDNGSDGDFVTQSPEILQADRDFDQKKSRNPQSRSCDFIQKRRKITIACGDFTSSDHDFTSF